MRMTLAMADKLLDEAEKCTHNLAFEKSTALSNLAIAELLHRLLEMQQNKGP